jgi:hypothetical protein
VETQDRKREGVYPQLLNVYRIPSTMHLYQVTVTSEKYRIKRLNEYVYAGSREQAVAIIQDKLKFREYQFINIQIYQL